MGDNEARLELNDSVTRVPGVGPARAKALAKLRIRTVRDLLLHLPRTYEDRRVITPIAALAEGVTVTICGRVKSSRSIRLRGRQSIAEVTLADDSGETRATFFGRGFLAKTFTKGASVVLTGTVASWKGLALKNPDYEILDDDTESALGRIVPVYALTEGITQRILRAWTAKAIETYPIDDAFGKPPVDESKSPFEGGFRGMSPDAGDFADALRTLHMPSDLAAIEPARRRIAYEELLALQLAILRKRREAKDEPGERHTVGGPRLSELRASLPFALTPGQQRAVDGILADMASPRPMRRLVQGDVGCGKTAVALHAIAAAADGGYQSAFLAPTELLAEQHYATLRKALEPLGLRTALLTATTGTRELRERIAAGGVEVVVGTHALFQEKTLFARLGFVIVDEQHRFGVAQRTRLTRKGAAPDVLHMTATPIPRSLALTVYGANDISVIRELPPGRRPIKTYIVPAQKEPDLYRFIVQEAQEGRQTYFVCPLIDESEVKSAAALTVRFDELSNGPLAEVHAAFVHGRMPAEEKDATVRRFAANEIDVLFATSIIEVGIDIPNATIMVLDDAAHFGLTQLHQLRGRVGRGADQSYCFLLGTPRTEDGRTRLETLVRCASGFDIAEVDLELRGPGEIYGARQSGLSDLRAADIVRDLDLLEAARDEAERLLAPR